ncbi:MAG: phosphate acyltransferase [Actinobacteria bacterium]|nr:phosphate acyltransferase [Actinomycetota bacterium]
MAALHERAADLRTDGEFQADAGLDPVVGRTKAPVSAVTGAANLLMFPNLTAGNISYELTERVGAAGRSARICRDWRCR